KQLKTSKDVSILHWIQNEKWPQTLFESSPNREPKDIISPSKIATSSEDTEPGDTEIENFTPFLESRGCFLNGTSKPDKADIALCKKLLKRHCEVPKDTTLDDYDYIQRILPERNETAVNLVIGRLVVPSAEIEIVRGRIEYEYLIDSIKEVWDGSVALDEPPGNDADNARNGQCQMPTPQPDYAVGFTEEAFTKEHFAKLEPFIGQLGHNSVFRGTLEMLFPFLTTEVRCSKASLEVADQHNAHSMARSLRGVVELFKLVKRERELDRKILGFSISHNHDTVRIYGYYPVFEMGTVTYHRYSVHTFSITAAKGKERWTSYKFVMALYNDWVPVHFQRLVSAVNDLPAGVNFAVDGIRRFSC
ncbi:hypothetical protein P170DRAFT_359297, partial [Aspergillus steynii IBT 23096]